MDFKLCNVARTQRSDGERNILVFILFKDKIPVVSKAYCSIKIWLSTRPGTARFCCVVRSSIVRVLCLKTEFLVFFYK